MPAIALSAQKEHERSRDNPEESRSEMHLTECGHLLPTKPARWRFRARGVDSSR